MGDDFLNKFKKKVKKTLIVVASVLVLLLCIFLKFFTGILGPPKYVYLNSYNDNTDGGIVSIKDVYKISIYDYTLKKAQYALKYCNNIKAIETYGDYYKNLNFLKGQDKLKELGLRGKCDDWSALKNCVNINNFYVINSNFNDFSLLKGFKQMSCLSIQTSEKIKYSDLETFESLEFLDIDALNIDFAEIIKAPSLDELWLQNVSEFKNSEKSKALNGITKLTIYNSELNYELLTVIPELSTIKDMYISKCTYSGDESEAKKIIKILTDKGLNAKIEDGIISISNS